jgi:hypothetical protein
MLDFMRGRATERKLRLFTCACCREVWELLRDEESQGRTAVLTGERHADGLVEEGDLLAARRRAEEAAVRAWALWDDGSPQAQEAAAAAAGVDPDEAATRASEYAAAALMAAAGDDTRAWKEAKRRQSDLLRDLFGNPLLPPLVPVQTWLDWGSSTVVKMAQSFYDDHRFEGLPVLADALEDAGCTNADVLSHLRGPGPHARGCWVLDALLRKN